MEEKLKQDTVQKPVLVVDIDDVLAEFVNSLNKFHNDFFDTDFKLQDYIHYDLENIWGGTKQDSLNKLFSFYDSKNFDDLNPVKDAFNALKELFKKFKIIAITGRPYKIKEKTENFIKKNFGNLIDEILFTNHILKQTVNMDKSSVCLSKGVRFIVEDHLGISNKCAEKGIKVFLINKSWNQGPLINENVQRVKDWNEILELLNSS